MRLRAYVCMYVHTCAYPFRTLPTYPFAGGLEAASMGHDAKSIGLKWVRRQSGTDQYN